MRELDNHMLDYDERDYEDELFICDECGEETIDEETCTECGATLITKEDRLINHQEDNARYKE